MAGAIVKQFHAMRTRMIPPSQYDGHWYAVWRSANGDYRYLLSDGTWHSAAIGYHPLRAAYFKTRAEAQANLDSAMAATGGAK